MYILTDGKGSIVLKSLWFAAVKAKQLELAVKENVWNLSIEYVI